MGARSLYGGLTAPMADDVALSMKGIYKSFGGIPVLKDVGLTVRKGEVHALLGENGAGKSTLMKILMGVHPLDSGEYMVGGRRVSFSGPSDAQRNRVSMVYQEFGLVPYMSVTENILMGRLPTRFGRIDWVTAREQAARTLERLGSTVPLDANVDDLKVADRQEVEIARALSYDPLVFIMDEPSSALSRAETDGLYRLVRTLREQGVAIIYITHKLEEVFALADRVTILRDGTVEGSYPIAELDVAMLVERMTGKKISADVALLASRDGERRQPILEISHLSAEGLFEDVSLTIEKGTVVGVAGLIGAGKSELARSIVGALPEGTHVTGGLTFDGAAVDVGSMSPHKARRLGIGFVSEDRQAEGIVQEQSIAFNVVLPALFRVTSASVVALRKVRALALDMMDAMRLRPRAPDKPVNLLSGGNQQKVVISKWIAAESKFIILDEPTRGIDIGARQEIYEVIRQQAREKGLGILLFSSDLREVLAASDRIFVMVRGRLVREIGAHEANERSLLDLVMPASNTDAQVNPA